MQRCNCYRENSPCNYKLGKKQYPKVFWESKESIFFLLIYQENVPIRIFLPECDTVQGRQKLSSTMNTREDSFLSYQIVITFPFLKYNQIDPGASMVWFLN